MKTLFRYPGAKTKLLPQIIPQIENQLKTSDGFFDAFVGGGSVLLAVASKFPDLYLYANDLDDFIFSFWRLISLGDIDDLCSLIQQKPTPDLYYELRKIEPKTYVEAAYRAVFFNRTSFSGDMRRSASMIGGKNQISKYKVDCRYNADKLIKQVITISKLLKGRLITYNSNIIELLTENTRWMDDKIHFYLDPPYWHAGNMLYEKRVSKYEHVVISEQLKKRSNWSLSYDNCSEIVELYKDQNIKLIDANYCIRGEKNSWHKTKELLILPS